METSSLHLGLCWVHDGIVTLTRTCEKKLFDCPYICLYLLLKTDRGIVVIEKSKGLRRAVSSYPAQSLQRP